LLNITGNNTNADNNFLTRVHVCFKSSFYINVDSKTLLIFSSGVLFIF